MPIAKKPRRSQPSISAAEKNAEKEILKSGVGKAEKNLPRTRLTISLSHSTMEIFDFLKAHTDAYTDSEVFRNALRFQYALLAKQIAGGKVYVVAKGKNEAVQIFPFAQETLSLSEEQPGEPPKTNVKRSARKPVNH